MPRPQHIIVSDLIFNKHRISDWKNELSKATKEPGKILCQQRLDAELQIRETLLEELLWEDQEALDQQLKLSCKDKLTKDELVDLKQINWILGKSPKHNSWLI
jgi:hypothetical protein